VATGNVSGRCTALRTNRLFFSISQDDPTEMIGNKIQHQSQAMPVELGAELPQRRRAAQGLGHGEIRHRVRAN
jgi:hypothetical protein